MLKIIIILFLGILSLYDLRSKSVPSVLLWLGALVIGGFGLYQHGIGSVLAGCVPGSALLVISVVRPGSLGMGDGLTAMIVGGAMGLADCFVWLLYGFGLAGIVGIWRLLIRKDTLQEQMALMPFLFLAAIGEALL